MVVPVRQRAVDGEAFGEEVEELDGPGHFPAVVVVLVVVVMGVVEAMILVLVVVVVREVLEIHSNLP